MSQILLADDHALVRQGLRLILETEPDLTVAGEAETTAAAVALARQLQPQLVLLDLRMPTAGGAATASAIKQAAPRSRVLILTGVADDAEIVAAAASNIDGYVLKDAPAEELLRAIRVILGGQAYLQPAVAKRLLRGLAARSGAAPPLSVPQLTPRELEVLRLLAGGQDSQQIAAVLTISAETARSHIKHLLHKLGQPTRTQTVLAALRLGIIALED